MSLSGTRSEGGADWVDGGFGMGTVGGSAGLLAGGPLGSMLERGTGSNGNGLN